MRRLIDPMKETIQISIVGTFSDRSSPFLWRFFPPETFAETLNYRILPKFSRAVPNDPLTRICSTFCLCVRIGSFPGMMALVVFTSGLVAKLGFEAIESIDPGPVEALESCGASKLSILRYAIIPQILPQYLSFVLYSFEINIRASAVLGYVGAGGIANYYNRTLSFLQYDRAGSIVILTFVVVMALDLVSSRIRERLL